MPSAERLADFRLPAQATAAFLAARWDMAAGKALSAGQQFHLAAELWKHAASALEPVSATESLRQRFNRWASLMEGGNIPMAIEEASVIHQRIAAAELEGVTRNGLESEWTGIQARLETRLREWESDFARLREEGKQQGGFSGLRRETAEHWLLRYPALPWSHWIASRAARATGDLESARKHVEHASALDPTDCVYLATYLDLATSTLPPHSAMQRIQTVYDEHHSRSAQLCVMYALAVLELSHKGQMSRAEAFERAIVSLDEAIRMTPSDLSLRVWGTAHLLRQYCYWRLGRPGVSAPWGVFYFQRGAEVEEIELPSPPGTQDPGDRCEEEFRSRLRPSA